MKKTDEIFWLISNMLKSENNLVLFKDDPKVLALYYLGIYLGIPTIIVIRKQDKKYIERLKHPLVKGFIQVDEFSSRTTCKIIADKVVKLIKSEKKS